MKKVLIVVDEVCGLRNSVEVIAEKVYIDLSSRDVDCEIVRTWMGYNVDKVEGKDLVIYGLTEKVNGEVTDTMKNFIYDIGYKPKNVCVYGKGMPIKGYSGDYLGAVDKMVDFHKSVCRPLKVPETEDINLDKMVSDWVDEVADCYNLN